jgi:Gas vesicle protein
MRRGRRRRAADPELDASLLDLVDHVLNKGVVVTGDVMLGLADVDLIYLRLTALLCAADRVTPTGATPALVPRPRRRRR